MRWCVSIGLATVLLAIPAMGQCALCRSAVETGDPSFAAVLRSGIVLLLVTPYLIGLVLAFLLWRALRRRKAAPVVLPEK